MEPSLFFLSPKLRLRTKFGRQHGADGADFTFTALGVWFGVVPVLLTGRITRLFGLLKGDFAGESTLISLASGPSCTFLSLSLLELSRKRSISCFGGGGPGIELRLAPRVTDFSDFRTVKQDLE